MAQCKEEASDIIHAEGVRVDFPSYAPKARNAFSFHSRPRVSGSDQPPRAKAPGPPIAFGARQNTALPRAKWLLRAAPGWVTFGEQSRVNSRECRSKSAF
ncbi:hypothetical protein SBA4_4480004 [Candidatus Sulfopaludibacter sp. SbA4]|nr:hypothetical protein SBA4_4480004 [Candidatus Sulfopaludibacter sp. SbA4]